MSVSASIDIRLGNRMDVPISKMQLIKQLLDYGWTLNDCGDVSYLPIGDEDRYNWQRENISTELLKAILDEKEKRGELIGVAMTWQASGIGGEFLLMKNGEVSVCLTINRKSLDGKNITDVNWYLSKLLPAFSQNNLIVESFSYEEHL